MKIDMFNLLNHLVEEQKDAEQKTGRNKLTLEDAASTFYPTLSVYHRQLALDLLQQYGLIIFNKKSSGTIGERPYNTLEWDITPAGHHYFELGSENMFHDFITDPSNRR